MIPSKEQLADIHWSADQVIDALQRLNAHMNKVQWFDEIDYLLPTFTVLIDIMRKVDSKVPSA